MPRPTQTFARFVATPENRAACVAVQELVGVFEKANTPSRVRNSQVLIHGAPGTGKSHLAHAAAGEATRLRPDFVVAVCNAADLTRAGQPLLFANDDTSDQTAQTPIMPEMRHCDMLVMEDLQHLNAPAAEAMVQVIDYLQARQRPMILTANTGPQRLCFRGQPMPARLTSRLAAGLVVRIEPLGPASRLLLLQTLAQRRQLAVPTDYLRWLADRLNGGGRQLEGAIAKLETLQKLNPCPLQLDDVQTEFQDQLEAGRITVDRIAQRVGSYFRVEPDALQSRSRYRKVLVPRQIGMYLARELTELSLEQIGKYFGGRDHSTVLHACRKVNRTLMREVVLSGAVRELRAELA